MAEYKKFDLFENRKKDNTRSESTTDTIDAKKLVKIRRKASRISSPFRSPSISNIGSPKRIRVNEKTGELSDRSYEGLLEPGNRSINQHKEGRQVDIVTPNGSLSTIYVPLKSTPFRATQFRRTPAKIGRSGSKNEKMKGDLGADDGNVNGDANGDSIGDISTRSLLDSIHKSLDEATNSVRIIGSRSGTRVGTPGGTPRVGTPLIGALERLSDYNDSNKFYREREEREREEREIKEREEAEQRRSEIKEIEAEELLRRKKEFRKKKQELRRIREEIKSVKVGKEAEKEDEIENEVNEDKEDKEDEEAKEAREDEEDEEDEENKEEVAQSEAQNEEAPQKEAQKEKEDASKASKAQKERQKTYKRSYDQMSQSDEEVESMFNQMNSTSNHIQSKFNKKSKKDWALDKWTQFAQLVREAKRSKNSNLIYNDKVMRQFGISDRIEANIRITLIKKFALAQREKKRRLT